MASILQRIFVEHWDEFVELYGHKIRKLVFNEVDKMVNCVSLSNGYIECGV